MTSWPGWRLSRKADAACCCLRFRLESQNIEPTSTTSRRGRDRSLGMSSSLSQVAGRQSR